MPENEETRDQKTAREEATMRFKYNTRAKRGLDGRTFTAYVVARVMNNDDVLYLSRTRDANREECTSWEQSLDRADRFDEPGLEEQTAIDAAGKYGGVAVTVTLTISKVRLKAKK